MGLIGLMTDDRVYYQIGSALCAADAVTGRTIWERRSISFPYSLEGDQDYVIALSRNEPNDPFGLVLEGRSGKQIFSGGFGMRGPLAAGDWHGHRVAMTLFTPRQVTRSMTDLVAKKVDWSRSYSLPAWPFAIDDQEFAVLDSGRTLHVHSSATGNQLSETPLGHSLNSPQLGVRRLGSRYIVLRQTGGFRVSPGSPERRPLAEGNGIWAIDRETGKVAWSAPLRRLSCSPSCLPVQSPVLVLLRPVSRFDLRPDRRVFQPSFQFSTRKRARRSTKGGREYFARANQRPPRLGCPCGHRDYRQASPGSHGKSLRRLTSGPTAFAPLSFGSQVI